jgi:tripartite-type tricarboxylate transporter receptor subunit TctC
MDGGSLMRRLLSASVASVAVLACGLAASSGAAAQTYPTKPIRIIVPFAPGGSTDQLARALEKPLGERLGQPVVIDNKVGAGGSIGVEQASRAPADGYTLVFGNTGPSAVAPLLRKLSYDPLKSYRPISTVAIAPLALVASGKVRAEGLKDFIAHAKGRGDELTYGSVGIGSMSHLTGEYFNQLAGTALRHIPYAGGSTLATAIMGGEIETAWVNPLDGTAMVASGKVRYLAVAAPKRLPAMPDVPTVAELLPGFESSAWFGLLAPKGTPDDVIAKLNAAVVAAVAQPEVRKLLEEKMVEPRSSAPEELEALIQREMAQWGAVIRKANITVN